MTNDDANFYINLNNRLLNLKKLKIIDDFEININDRKLIIDKTIIPQKTIKKINIDFIITQDGCKFK